MKGQQQLGVKGGYSLRVFKDDGREVKDKYIPFVQNIVTDLGLEEEILSNTQFNEKSEVAVGTGTSAITQASTSLISELKRTSGLEMQPSQENNGFVSFTDNGDGTITIRGVRNGSFNIGDFNGDSISEVGIIKSFTSGLLAGQLIKDQNGNPTTITILSDEQLVIEYVIEHTSWFTQQSLSTGSITANGVTSNYTFKINPWLRSDSFSDSFISPITTKVDENSMLFYDSVGDVIAPVSISGNSYLFSSISNGAKVTLDFSGTASPSSFSTTDLKYIAFGTTFDRADILDIFESSIGFILEFDTPLEKTSSQAITIDFSVDITAIQS